MVRNSSFGKHHATTPSTKSSISSCFDRILKKRTGLVACSRHSTSSTCASVVHLLRHGRQVLAPCAFAYSFRTRTWNQRSSRLSCLFYCTVVLPQYVVAVVKGRLAYPRTLYQVQYSRTRSQIVISLIHECLENLSHHLYSHHVWAVEVRCVYLWKKFIYHHKS